MWAVSLPQASPGSTGSMRPFTPAAAGSGQEAVFMSQDTGGDAQGGMAWAKVPTC
jgi:hypothetical protein